MSNPKWEVGPVKLLNGDEAIITHINDQNNCHKYVGVRRCGASWIPFGWEVTGQPSDCNFDAKKLSLAPPPKKTLRVERWILVYPSGVTVTYSSPLLQQTIEMAKKEGFGLFKLDREVVEGEGL